MLIFTFNVLVNNSIAAANGKNVQPLDIPNVEDNDIISMPFLKLHSCTCNCTASYPQQVILEGDEENDQNNAHTSGTPNTRSRLSRQDEQEIEEIMNILNDGEEIECTTNEPEVCYSESFQLKGSTFHPEFQRTLKDCKEILLNNSSNIELTFFKKPVNVNDENAIVVQANINGHLSSIGYIPGMKIAKIEAAIESNKIVGIVLSRVQYTYIWGAGEHKYIPFITVTKKGKWAADDKHYKYNNTI